MNFKNTLQYVLTLVVVIAAAYFFYLQFKNNADMINAYDFSIRPFYLLISMILGASALLSGPFVWRIYVNSYLDEKLNYAEGFTLYCTSAMFKYIPGKIWTYAAQIALMSSKGISNVVLIYINIASFICLLFATAIYFHYYYFFYLKMATFGLSIVVLGVLIFADIIFVIWSNSIINYLIVPVNLIFKVNIQPIKTKRSILVFSQIVYFFAFLMLGLAFYFLAKGINVEIPFSYIFAIVATISASIILGLLAFFSIGGLGVREGTMFFMLKQFTGIEGALILPILARLFTIIDELVILIVAVMIGLKFGYFKHLGKNK